MQNNFSVRTKIFNDENSGELGVYAKYIPGNGDIVGRGGCRVVLPNHAACQELYWYINTLPRAGYTALEFFDLFVEKIKLIKQKHSVG